MTKVTVNKLNTSPNYTLCYYISDYTNQSVIDSLYLYYKYDKLTCDYIIYNKKVYSISNILEFFKSLDGDCSDGSCSDGKDEVCDKIARKFLKSKYGIPDDIKCINAIIETDPEFALFNPSYVVFSGRDNIQYMMSTLISQDIYELTSPSLFEVIVDDKRYIIDIPCIDYD